MFTNRHDNFLHELDMARLIQTSILILLLSPPTFAQSVIHKCVDADGNIAFQDSPCPDPAVQPEPKAEPEPKADESLTEAIPAEDFEPAEVVSYEPVASNRSAEEVEACKEPHRDAIDNIEAEMLRGYSAEQGEIYKQELRTLTQAMRACE
jgi:hypothetical protein